MFSFKCYGQAISWNRPYHSFKKEISLCKRLTMAAVPMCCGLLSVFGIFFLFSVGHMFATEPMFTDPEVWHDGHGDDASFNCYMGGVIYICTLVASIGCILYDRKRSLQRPSIAHDASLGGFVNNPLNLGVPPGGDFDSNSVEEREMARYPVVA